MRNGKLRGLLITVMLLVFLAGLASILYPYIWGAAVDSSIASTAKDFLEREEPELPATTVIIDSIKPEKVKPYRDDGNGGVERYPYTICHVKLENFDLSHVPVYVMNEKSLSRYALYMATLGNRPDLFPDSESVDRLKNGYEDYDIPDEALSDTRFAAMIAEAEKYLGYPYVWGGSSPSTSFDCSGFVCWVVNHSGWSLGRTSAQGLFNACTPISRGNARPGDLIFFQGTYDTPGVSHVGIYVGNNRMIHCGNPISYTIINTQYWQSHFYAFGRLPR